MKSVCLEQQIAG